MNIRLVEKLCYGCRACELACSFHHQGRFAPAGGSLRVSKDNRTGKINWERKDSCDFCVGEERKLCFQYCLYGALEWVEDERK